MSKARHLFSHLCCRTSQLFRQPARLFSSTFRPPSGKKSRHGRIREPSPFAVFTKHGLFLKYRFGGVVLDNAISGTGFDKINIDTERFKIELGRPESSCWRVSVSVISYFTVRSRTGNTVRGGFRNRKTSHPRH